MPRNQSPVPDSFCCFLITSAACRACTCVAMLAMYNGMAYEAGRGADSPSGPASAEHVGLLAHI